MKIQELYKGRQIPDVASKPKLKRGQILQGNIRAIFPNGRAQINLGSQQFVAQLQASLSVGKSYYFQIQQVEDDLIHLRVLTEQADGNARENLSNLLRQLGIKPTTEQLSFLQSFINDRIPFQQSEIVPAMNLYSNASNKDVAQTVLKQMFLQQLPINETVFQSLYINRTNNFTNVIRSLEQTIQSNNFPGLSNHLQRLIKGNQSTRAHLTRQALTNVMNTEAGLSHALRSIGIELQAEKTRQQSANITQSSQPGQSNEIVSIKNILNHLLQNQQTLINHSRVLLNEWNNLPINLRNADLAQFAHIKQIINDRIVPLLAPEQQQHVLNLLEQNQLSQLFELFTNLSTEKTFQLANQVQTAINHELPKQYFLHQLNQILSQTGLSYENMLARNDDSQQTSLKSMLLQYVEQYEGINKERAHQLLQFINGLQIQSVQESTHFIQANLVLPAENLGLNHDLNLEFESKKTTDGKINPNYCRILFYLDLAQLRETIIDMNIQKRLVSLTIYNDQTSQIQSLSKLFKSKLTEGLLALDYELTKLSIKHLTEQSVGSTEDGTQHVLQQSTYEGIDFKV